MNEWFKSANLIMLSILMLQLAILSKFTWACVIKNYDVAENSPYTTPIIGDFFFLFLGIGFCGTEHFYSYGMQRICETAWRELLIRAFCSLLTHAIEVYFSCNSCRAVYVYQNPPEQLTSLLLDVIINEGKSMWAGPWKTCLMSYPKPAQSDQRLCCSLPW